MKKALLIILIILSVWAIVAFGQPAPDNRLTVALDVRGVVPTGAGKMLKGELGKAIGRTQKYVVVNRSPEVLKALAQEIKYTQSGATKDAEALKKKIGQQDTVQFLCVVELSGSNGEYYVIAKFIHVASAREGEAASAVSRFENDREVMAVAQRLALELTGVNLGTGETFTDSRDGKIYKKIAIGTQVWMAENLNYAAEGSVCYEDYAENCAKYGRLYDWDTANKACPAGWRLPRNDEWDTLVNYVGGDSTAGTKLKASTGWYNKGSVPASTDDYGFSALPGGEGYIGFKAGKRGYWWSATAAGSIYSIWFCVMYHDEESVGRSKNGSKDYQFSVRCLQD